MEHRVLVDMHDMTVIVYRPDKQALANRKGGQKILRFFMADNHCQVLEGKPDQDDANAEDINTAAAKTMARVGDGPLALGTATPAGGGKQTGGPGRV